MDSSSPVTPQNCKKVRKTFLLAITTRHLFLASVLKFFQLQNEKKDQKKKILHLMPLLQLLLQSLKFSCS